MAALGQGDFKKAEEWALKSVQRYRDLNQREELSLGLAVLIYTQLSLYQFQQAELNLCKVIQIGIEIQGVYPILYILFAAALLLIERGEVEKAMEISGLVERYPFVKKSRWFEDIAGNKIITMAESLTPDDLFAARERGRNRDIWATAAELLETFAVGEKIRRIEEPRRSFSSKTTALMTMFHTG